MARCFGKGVVLTVGLGTGLAPIVGTGPARGQAIREREVTITGPRGNTLQRDFKSVRGPGFVDRQTTIHRPGGATFHGNTVLQRPAPVVVRGGHGGPHWGGPHWGGPHWGGPRPVIVNNGVGLGNGLVDFGLGALAGGALGVIATRAFTPPPPPVVVTPPPVVASAPAVAAAPVVVAPAAPAPPPVVQYVTPPPVQQVATQVVPPEVAAALQRLQSRHNNSRRDGCLALGRIGDDRAVGPLVDRLKNDPAREVRVAAATALGQIGDPGAAVYLERSIVYDKKQDVRDAAAAALARVQRPAADPVAVPADAPPPVQLEPIEQVPPPPTPFNPR